MWTLGCQGYSGGLTGGFTRGNRSGLTVRYSREPVSGHSNVQCSVVVGFEELCYRGGILSGCMRKVV